jgi:hypothetical protein
LMIRGWLGLWMEIIDEDKEGISAQEGHVMDAEGMAWTLERSSLACARRGKSLRMVILMRPKRETKGGYT